MVMFLAIDQRMAQGTNHSYYAAINWLFATYNYYSAEYVNIKYALMIAIVFMPGRFLSLFEMKFFFNGLLFL